MHVVIQSDYISSNNGLASWILIVGTTFFNYVSCLYFGLYSTL